MEIRAVKEINRVPESFVLAGETRAVNWAVREVWIFNLSRDCRLNSGSGKITIN